MFGLENISIEFLSGTMYLVIPSFLILIALSVFLYYRTNPPVKRWYRYLLLLLRITAVTAVILALSEPVISYVRNYEKQLSVTVLLDQSLSMNETEDDKSRLARRDALLSSDAYERLASKVDLNVVYFGGNLSENSDEIDRDKTALGDILKEENAAEIGRSADYWLLFSDGNSNSGADPKTVTERLLSPVTVFDMSLKSGSFDIAVDNLEFNPIVFAGQPTEIKLKLRWRNLENQNVTVSLVDSGKTVLNKTFEIRQKEGLGEITLNYIPDNPGLKILNIGSSVIPDELNKENNRKSFTVKVLKSRLKLLLAADAPDYEIGFLNRYLKNSDRYDVDLKITGAKAGNLAAQIPSQQTELNQYDLLILYDPDINELNAKKDILLSYLKDRGGAVWILMGKRFAATKTPDWLSEILPFSTNGIKSFQYRTFQVEPSEGQLYHPSVRLDDNYAAIRKTWSELPPFKELISCERQNPNGVILARYNQGTARQPLPVMGYLRVGASKLFATAMLPFWPWDFVQQGLGEDNANYGKFIEGTIGWLTVDDDLEPIRISPDKNVYHRGESIVFNGFAFDAGFKPLPGVSGTVTVKGTDQDISYEADLDMVEEGSYRSVFNNLPAGEYSYTAEFTKEGNVLKHSEGKLLVETFSVEEYDVGGRPDILRSIASQSGGEYYTASQFEEGLNSLDIEPTAVSIKKEIPLKNKLWLLIVFIAALGIEWVLRKMNQLI